MSETQNVLIVDDDRGIVELLSKYLTSQGFSVRDAGNIAEFRAKLAEEEPDIVVLDVMLPDGSGLNTCQEMRKAGVTTPIILLTAVTDDVDRILGLEFGADDYIGKPFNPRELVARIKAVLRRVTGTPAKEPEDVGNYHFAGFVADPNDRSVRTAGGEDIALTGAEFNLLLAFLNNPQRLISRERLLELTNKSTETFDTAINPLISRIRKKLSVAGADEDLFRTVRNGGYQLTSKVDRS
jgi:DNA-binding response OmpR family regulator